MRLPIQLFGNSLETLESPFLDQEIVGRASDRALDSAEQYDEGRAVAESQPDADREADADRADEHDEALAFQGEDFLDRDEVASEEEILGNEDRTLVTDTLKIPNRWICAIDILTDNPDWGKHGQPQFLIKSRGTGTLIGSRYVLTAGHVIEAQAKGFLISPARNGSNATNPLGKVKSKSVHVSPVRQMTRTVGQGSQARRVQFSEQDDYALIVLERDLAASTHAKMKGALNYWGSDQSVAVVRRLDPSDINGKDIDVTGYPGDACGKSIVTGSTAADKKKKIDNCWNRRNDEWASTQWRCTGTAQVDPDLRRIFHTADTYSGQSGAPICLSFESKLNLIGIHTAPHDAQTNLGFRVTRRMLTELSGWINADAGYAAATVQNDTLVLQPPPAKAPAKGAKEVFEEEDAAELLGEEPSTTGESLLTDESPSPLEERFDPAAVPQDVAEARDKKDWPLALKLAIHAGWHDENELTNLVFFAKHPLLPPGPLDPKNPKFHELGAEWTTILKKDVRPAVSKACEDTTLKVSGDYVAERDPMFSGAVGKKFKELVEWAAAEVDINPGLLGAILLAEWDDRSLYLQSGEVRSFVSGTDDFYAQRERLRANVPAFAKVRFDATKQRSNANEHGRKVTTVPFKSGRDAALATAVYVKYAEIKLRKAADKNGSGFAALPVETRFALVRLAMAAGHGGISLDGDFIFFKKKNDTWVEAKKGEAGATLFGVASRLQRVLKGEDILIRKNEPRGDPTRSGHITNRNATILVAQAMHLSDWFFGTPLQAGAQPELEQFDLEAMEHLYLTSEPLAEKEDDNENGNDNEEEDKDDEARISFSGG